MSFTDRVLLWLHIAFAVFAIGPATAAIMSTPRQIRARNVAVVRHLLRSTRVYSVLTLGVAIFGGVLGEAKHELGKVWLTVSMTLFVVALVCLVLIMRDQTRAIVALESSASDEALAVAAASPPPAKPVLAGPDGAAAPGGTDTPAAKPDPATPSQVANVERGRIASLGGIVGLIWLAILVLMVWQP
ncbi:MAG TPA: hypothetical protein VGS19_07770 [Streptosporangiaceae bacterium]|nr:hypothetical protein [Streptosporangiaceae bacterium]